MQKSLLLGITLIVAPAIGLAGGWEKPEGAVEEQCFQCFLGSAGGCPEGQHMDLGFWFDRDSHGEKHTSCISQGCVHTYYGPSSLRQIGTEVRNAVATASDADIVRVIGEFKNVELNRGRSAIQVVGDNGEVWLHAPISVELTQSVSLALDALEK